MVSLHAIIALVIATSVTSQAFSIEVDDFGTDSNFGSENTNAKCYGSCKSDEDCCDGYRCKRFFSGSKYGYCAKFCQPARPGEDCRQCLTCTKGHSCTILLTNKYVCLPHYKRY